MSDNQSSKKTTIYDLAVLAGTSPGTVSAVLNGNWQKRRISKSLAEKVQKLADAHGYAANMQARALRRERSGIIGMIIPMYDNRYFSSIAQTFESAARLRGLLPIVISTQRDPDLEASAAKAMLAYQVEHLICAGATDPDRIHDLCAAAGVPTFNLDLPGTKAPSVISDNFGGALELTRRVLNRIDQKNGDIANVIFVGGRQTDHNTIERIRGFTSAYEERGITPRPDQILACGYAAHKASQALSEALASYSNGLSGMFVNSTISLEGVMTYLDQVGDLKDQTFPIGCFDWDPFAAMLRPEIEMVKQDVASMMAQVFELVDNKASGQVLLFEIPPIFRQQNPD